MAKKKLKKPILFITRTYPPILGGMENLSYNLIRSVSNLTPSYAVKNPYGKKLLPLFIPWAFLKAIFFILFARVKLIHLSDGVLAPIGLILKIMFPWIKVIITIHGLDITYAEKFSPYYFTNVLAIRKMDSIITVSNHTKEECISYGVPKEKIRIVQNGVDTKDLFIPKLRDNKEEQQKIWNRFFPKLKGKVNFQKDNVVFSLGRLMKHKGISWFTEEVIPEISKKTVLIIAGMGPEKPVLEDIIKKKKLENRVFLLGAVSDSAKKFLLNSADIMIMPNIELPGFREGFGITAIEGGSCELVPIVADIQGLRDAVKDKRNGLRIPTGSIDEFVKAVEYVGDHPKYQRSLGKKARKYVVKHFDWSVVGKKYLEVFKEVENS